MAIFHAVPGGFVDSLSHSPHQVHIELKEISHVNYRAMHGMEAKKGKHVEPELAPDGEVWA